jgi:ketosteroid isomerase-like protein
MMTSELIDSYYEGLTRKDGWQAFISDTMTFMSPGGAVTEGSAAFIEGNRRFLRAVQGATKKQAIIDGDTACIWMSYALVSPRGKQATLDVVEIWTVKGGRLDSLRIYFDTEAFRTFMQAA